MFCWIYPTPNNEKVKDIEKSWMNQTEESANRAEIDEEIEPVEVGLLLRLYHFLVVSFFISQQIDLFRAKRDHIRLQTTCTWERITTCCLLSNLFQGRRQRLKWRTTNCDLSSTIATIPRQYQPRVWTEESNQRQSCAYHAENVNEGEQQNGVESTELRVSHPRTENWRQIDCARPGKLQCIRFPAQWERVKRVHTYAGSKPASLVKNRMRLALTE